MNVIYLPLQDVKLFVSLGMITVPAGQTRQVDFPSSG